MKNQSKTEYICTCGNSKYFEYLYRKGKWVSWKCKWCEKVIKH